MKTTLTRRSPRSAADLWREIRHRFVAQGACLVWTGSKSPEGYGHIGRSDCGKLSYHNVHALAYQAMVGPVPPGCELDHVCRNRACAEISHLQPVSSRENSMRGQHPNYVTNRTGVCRQGHAISGANAMRRVDGRLRCRQCTRIAARARRAGVSK